MRSSARSVVVARLLRHIVADAHAPTHALCSPMDGSLLAHVPHVSTEAVCRAAATARAAQRAWTKTSLRERARVLIRFHDLLLARREEVLDLIQLETGKARRDAYEEALDAAICARHYAYHGASILRRQRRRGVIPGLTATWEQHLPFGLVGFISPWNYPLSLSITDILPALLAGNAALLKPDQQTPLTALWAVDLLVEAGLPSGLIAVATGSGRELGPTLISQVDFICFTGSTATGRLVARQAGERLIGCSLELGGKNPLIIFDDADVNRAVEGAVRACFSNTGQLCISTERAYVQRGLYDRFSRALVDRTARLRLGVDFDPDTEIGSLASAEQLAKVTDHVSGAVAAGARVLVGGRARPDLGPLVYEPTVLTGVTSDMAVYADETFGPVVALYPFDTIDEVVAAANASPYGLNASVWSRNTYAAMALAGRLQVGTVNINDAYAATWGSVDAPMGGMKDSGLGRRHGAVGILKYTEAQTIAVQRLLSIGAPRGVREMTYERVMGWLMRLLRYLPGLR